MPTKKTQITDADRAKNMRALAREVGASEDPGILERALKIVAERQATQAKANAAKK